jgi:exonuclease III
MAMKAMNLVQKDGGTAMTSKINYTLLAYQEGQSYTDRCGDRFSHDGSFAFHCSTDEDEIIELWSGYLFKNQKLEEAELEYELTLLQNGRQYADAEYDTDEYMAFEGNQDRIQALAKVAIIKHLEEKKKSDALAKERAAAAQLIKQQQWAEQVAAAELATYKALKAKYG